MANKLKLAITFDPVLLKRVDAAAKSLGVSRSAFIENACRSGLEETEAMANAMGNTHVREAFFEAMRDPKVLAGLAQAMNVNLSPKQQAAAQGIMPEIEKEMLSEAKAIREVRGAKRRGKKS